MKYFIKAVAMIIAITFAVPTPQVFAASTDGVRVMGFTLFKRKSEPKRVKKTRKYRKKTRKSSRKHRKKSRKKIRRTAKSRAKARRIARAKAKRAKLRRAKIRRAAVARAKREKLYQRTNVRFRTREKPGTIIVDTKTRHLYHVRGNGRATRYGVAVGKRGFEWKGTSRIRRKVKWPTWTPPAEMIERKPKLAKWKDGQPGGPDNPLGAAALYLYQGKVDTLYRIHGTNNPGSIGRAASSGCIRMKNADIQHLYARIGNGTKVIVR